MKTKEKVALMGQVVTVTKLLKKNDSQHKKREWIFVDTPPFSGWIVGITVRQCGTCVAGDGEYDPPYLDVTSTVPCVLVARWVNSRPVEVPLDGFTLGGEPKPPAYKWTYKDREFMRNEAKSFPRINGRFAKYNK